MTHKLSKVSKHNFQELTDSQLLSWYVMFLNGADYNSNECYEEWKAFKEEVENRSQEVQDKVAYLDSVL